MWEGERRRQQLNGEISGNHSDARMRAEETNGKVAGVSLVTASVTSQQLPLSQARLGSAGEGSDLRRCERSTLLRIAAEGCKACGCHPLHGGGGRDAGVIVVMIKCVIRTFKVTRCYGSDARAVSTRFARHVVFESFVRMRRSRGVVLAPIPSHPLLLCRACSKVARCYLLCDCRPPPPFCAFLRH